MSATERRRSGSGMEPGQIAMGAGLGLLLLTGGVLWSGIHLGRLIDSGQPALPSDNPIVLPIYLASGRLPMTAIDWVCVGVIAVLLIAAAAWAVRLLLRSRGPARSHDRAARYMGRGKELDRLLLATVTAVAIRLRVLGGVPGLELGRTVAGNIELYADWESSVVALAGARVGKTTSIVIPWILRAPGACLVTSNRRDVVDGTRGVRPGWKYVFDPQQIVGEEPIFYWDPLSYVLSGPQGSEVKAQALAGIFATATAPPDSRADRFFDPKGQNLLGHFLHAAALKGYPIPKVYEWVTDERNREAAKILDEAGFPMSAKAVLAIMASPDKQRGGIYATAELCVAWLTNRSAVRWLVPGEGRVAFDPAAFAESMDTLYLISREGRGSLAALTTALAAATCEAAEHLATHSPGGRLQTPMTCVLDEVANVCRWPDLPDLFSHYGGRGIFLVAILQSWSQGVGVWGERAMTAMWSTASINLFLGGVREAKFLRELTELVGTYRTQQVNTSHGRQGASVSYSEGEEAILSTADLQSLPRGRALLLASGTRATMVKTRQWKDTDYADAVKASFLAYDPAPLETLAEADAEAAAIDELDVPPPGAAWRGRGR